MDLRAVSSWARVSQRRRATAWPEHHAGVDVVEARRGDSPPPLDAELVAGTVYRFVMGIDKNPVALGREDVSAFADVFAETILLATAPAPLTANGVLDNLASLGVVNRFYLISEAGQIPPGIPGLHRDMRFAVAVHQSTPGGTSADDADLLISTSALGDPETVFLQVAAWSQPSGLFNYYMRLAQSWVWAGNSDSALAPGSRGEGCFDSHVNGSLVMKELKSPWNNWQSMKATILVDTADPIRQNPFYQNLSGAEDLERTVRGGIRRWTTARLDRINAAGHIEHPDWLARHLFTTTTVNLTSTDIESRTAVEHRASTVLTLPLGFWLNADMLLDELSVPADFDPPTVAGELYAASLEKYAFALTDGAFRQPGDTFFAFLVPEASAEDNEVIAQLVRRDLIDAKFATCVLMVDFPNPVFSARRAALMSYIPTALSPGAGGSLGQAIANNILAAATSSPAASPEREFAQNWALGDDAWPAVFAQRIVAYMAAVTTRAQTTAGFDDYVRLAESRRRLFARRRLFEFSLTIPATTIPVDAPTLQMRADGTVGPQ